MNGAVLVPVFHPLQDHGVVSGPEDELALLRIVAGEPARDLFRRHQVKEFDPGTLPGETLFPLRRPDFARVGDFHGRAAQAS